MTYRLVWIVALAACSGGSQISAPPAEGPRPPPAPTPTAAAPDPAPPAFRLPGDVVPVRYQLELTVVPEATTARGQIAIAAKVVRPTRVVWLNAHGLTLDHATLAGRPARVIAGGEQFVGLAADAELPAGDLQIATAFTAAIDHDKSVGIYAATEHDATYAYTFFEAIDARRAFPCFDEPAYKAPWQLVLHVPHDQLARANTAIVKETAEPAGAAGPALKRVEFAETKPLASYLVAFMVGPFDDIDDGVTGRAHTPVHFIVPKGRAGELGFAKQITPKVVAALEDYFAMDYPFGKLDVAVVPRYWGTMEHPGLVAMGQPLTLIRPEEDTREREERYTDILAHELGHYWFGDLVTMAWFDDTWLNESFGQWLDLVITDAVMPQWQMLEGRVAQATEAMATDETLSAQPIRLPVTTNEAIQASFDGDLTYQKGSSVLRQLEHFVGRDRWQAFLRGYVRRHAWGNVTGPELFAEIRAELGKPAGDAAELYFTRPGVPLAHLHAECKPSAKLVLDPMARALPAGVVEPADDQLTYAVPVCARFGDAHHSDEACTTGAPIEVAYCPTWIVPNAGAYGYYRSRLDPAMAIALLDPTTAIAKLARPTSAERRMIIADVAAMVSRDELAIDRALPLVAKLLADRDPKVAASANFVALHSSGLPEPMFAALQRWKTATYAPLARALGWQRAPGDSDDRERLRAAALYQAVYSDPTTAAQSRKLALGWLRDRKGLPDDLVGLALGGAAHWGDAALFDAYLDAEHHARDNTERQRLLAALAEFTAPALSQRARDLLIDPAVDPRDAVIVLYLQLTTHDNREAMLGWLEAHLDALLARHRDDENAGIVGAIAEAFCDAPHRERVATLLAPRASKIDGAQAVLARGLELTDHCIAEVAREMPALQRFFKLR